MKTIIEVDELVYEYGQAPSGSTEKTSGGQAKSPGGPAEAPGRQANSPSGPAEAPGGQAKSPSGPAEAPGGQAKSPNGPTEKAPGGQAKSPGGPLNEPANEPRALDGLSFSIEEGAFVAILGQNGSGKSTLAKCINALYMPTAGRVLVDGMDTADETHLWDIRSTAGMVFQNPDNQLVSSVVEDDVAFGPENLGVPTDEIRQRVDAAMQAVGIYEQRLRPVHLLSGGQKQRVAIAGVLAMGPRCVLFDESTAMLDPSGRREVLAIIRELHGQGISTILITHNMEEVVEADRVLVLQAGRIVLDGTPEAIFAGGNQAALEACGLDLPAAVKMRNALQARGVAIPDTILDVEGLAAWLAKEGGPACASK